MSDVSELVRAARRRRGWTQAELAERLEVSRAQVSNWERGDSDLSGSTLLRLFAVAGWQVVEVIHPRP